MIQKIEANGVVKWRGRLGRGRLRTFNTRKAAQEYVDQERANKRRLKAGLLIEREGVTYNELCEMFLIGYDAQTFAWTKLMLSYSRKKFGKEYVRQIRSEDITRWLAALPYSPKTKRHILERMRLVFNKGIEWGYLGISPARGKAVTTPKGGRLTEIMPFQTWAEVEAVADAMPTPLDNAVVRFACATGLRPSEWQRLKWADVDFKRRQIVVHGTKNANAQRVLNLSQLAYDALTTAEHDLVLVFPIVTYYYWRKDRWRDALKKAGLAQRPPGQMRHTFATLALSAGVPIDAVSKMLGHANIGITLTYYAKHTPASMQHYAAMFDKLKEPSE